jgi:hypothetical protein
VPGRTSHPQRKAPEEAGEWRKRCSSTVNPLSASKSVTIGWYNCCEGMSGSLSLNWPPIYAGQDDYYPRYGTTIYRAVSAR